MSTSTTLPGSPSRYRNHHHHARGGGSSLLLAHDLDRHVAVRELRSAGQPDLGDVVDVAEVLALLVAVRRQMLCTGDDLDPAQAARALTDARGLDAGRYPRAGLEQRRARGKVDDEGFAVPDDRYERHNPRR